MSVPSTLASDEVLRPAVDWQTALDSMGGDADLLKSVVDVLLAEGPRQLEVICQSAARGDAKELRRAAHTLKGSLGYFGAEAAARVAEAIEILGQSGNTNVTDEMMERLRGAMAEVLRELLEFQRRNASHAP